MSDLLVRAFTPDLEVRSSAKGRTIVGIAVPWDVEQLIDDGITDVEGFRRGAFDHQLDAWHRVKLSREHITRGGQLIGRGLLARNDAAGLYVELAAARTLAADETLALVEGGALSNLSIAFRDRKTTRGRSTAYPGHGVEWRTKADAAEVAIVLEGAYGDLALATGVRNAPAERPGLAEARRALQSLPSLPPVR